MPNLNTCGKQILKNVFRHGKWRQAMPVIELLKHYYPDSPKGYQITQNYKAITDKGYVEIQLDNGEKRQIGIDI